MYADHTQVYGSCRPADVVSFSTKLSRCVDETSGWMKSNRLESNPDKAEVGGPLACDELTPVSTADHCTVNWRVAVDPVTSVRDLRIYIDTDLVMRTHVQRTWCFKMFRCFSSTTSDPGSVPPSTFQSLMVTLVLSRLDFLSTSQNLSFQTIVSWSHYLTWHLS